MIPGGGLSAGDTWSWGEDGCSQLALVPSKAVPGLGHHCGVLAPSPPTPRTPRGFAAAIRGTGRRCWSRRAGGKRIKQQLAGSARGGLAQPGTDLLPSAPHPAGWERAAAQQAPHLTPQDSSLRHAEGARSPAATPARPCTCEEAAGTLQRRGSPGGKWLQQHWQLVGFLGHPSLRHLGVCSAPFRCQVGVGAGS